MKTEETNQKEKKDYTKLLLGIGGVALVCSHIAAYISGYGFAWNICNNQMSMKEARYIAKNYLTPEQIKEVYDELFTNQIVSH